jgi:hypothetical protein
MGAEPAEPLRRITSEEELTAVEPTDGLQLLMIARPDCRYLPRVERALARRLSDNPLLSGLVWSVDDDATAASLGATRTPFVIVFDRGERTFDFVAQSEGALVFGLQEVYSLRDAYASPPE